jgi:hypothetical protein
MDTYGFEQRWGTILVLAQGATRLAPISRTCAIVLMPEASVNENHLSASDERHVGRPWDLAAMKPISEAKISHDPSHDQLGLRICIADLRHAPPHYFVYVGKWHREIHRTAIDFDLCHSLQAPDSHPRRP